MTSTTYAGGVILRNIEYTERFKKDYRNLDSNLQLRVDAKLRDLLLTVPAMGRDRRGSPAAGIVPPLVESSP